MDYGINPDYIDMEKTLKIILAILLFLCLLDMPYGYYQLVRFIAMGVFGYLAFLAFQETRQGEAIIFVLLALLFQPLWKIALGRELWNIVDVVVGIGLLVSAFRSQTIKNGK